MTDPADPDQALGPLPPEVHQEILEYASRYDPRRPPPERRIIPTGDQVEAAARWVQARRRQSA